MNGRTIDDSGEGVPLIELLGALPAVGPSPLRIEVAGQTLNTSLELIPRRVW